MRSTSKQSNYYYRELIKPNHTYARDQFQIISQSFLVAERTTTTTLAAERTRRMDPLDGLRLYAGGWNISNMHYITSVVFSAAPVFAAAAVWFLAFALASLVACCCRCCSGKTVSDYTYSRRTFAVSLLLLLAFTAAAVVGCAVLYDGQGKLHGSTSATLRYVVNQSDSAAASLRGFAGFIETAKAAGHGSWLVDGVSGDATGNLDPNEEDEGKAMRGVSTRAGEPEKDTVRVRNLDACG